MAHYGLVVAVDAAVVDAVVAQMRSLLRSLYDQDDHIRADIKCG